MNVQEFQRRIEAQGVDYIGFVVLTIQVSVNWNKRSDVENKLILPNATFYSVIAEAFPWAHSRAGIEFWSDVAMERRVPIQAGEEQIPASTSTFKCNCELYSLLRDGCKCGGI